MGFWGFGVYPLDGTNFGKVVVINFYSAPRKQGQCEKELVFLTNSIRQLHPNVDVIVAGDFNCAATSLAALATRLGQIPAVPTDETNWHTREQRITTRLSKSTLDYFLSSHPATGLCHPPLSLPSDHLPIQVDFVVTSCGQYSNGILFQNRLKRGTRLKTITKIMTESAWPRVSFIEAAKAYQRTQVSKLKNSKAHRLVEHVNSAKRSQDPDLRSSAIQTAQQELSPHQHRRLVATVTGLLVEKGSAVHAEEIKVIVDKIRCKLPKVFYDAVKRATKNSQSSLLALGFAPNESPDGTLNPAASFDEYLTELYFKDGISTPPPVHAPGPKISITAEEVVQALKKLSFNKAVGLDQLKDHVLRQAIKGSPEVAAKLASSFQKWINGEETIPAYLKVARTVMLSKSDSQYPPEGDVRVIAILPALTKLYEVFL